MSVVANKNAKRVAWGVTLVPMRSEQIGQRSPNATAHRRAAGRASCGHPQKGVHNPRIGVGRRRRRAVHLTCGRVRERRRRVRRGAPPPEPRSVPPRRATHAGLRSWRRSRRAPRCAASFRRRSRGRESGGRGFEGRPLGSVSDHDERQASLLGPGHRGVDPLGRDEAANAHGERCAYPGNALFGDLRGARSRVRRSGTARPWPRARRVGRRGGGGDGRGHPRARGRRTSNVRCASRSAARSPRALAPRARRGVGRPLRARRPRAAGLGRASLRASRWARRTAPPWAPRFDRTPRAPRFAARVRPMLRRRRAAEATHAPASRTRAIRTPPRRRRSPRRPPRRTA